MNIDTGSNPRIVLFISDDMYSAVAFKDIIEKYDQNIVAVINCKSVAGSLLKRLRRKYSIAKKAGFNFALYKLLETTGYKIISILKGKPSFNRLTKKHHIKYLRSRDVSNPNLISTLRSLNPDIIFSTTTQIIKKKFFTSIDIPVLNGHGSLLPRYRGATQYIWYLMNKDRIGGVTVHMMEPGIDSGNIIMQKKFSISQKDSAYKIHYNIAKELSVLFSAIFDKLIKHSKIASIKQDEKLASYCNIPTRQDIKTFRKNYKLIRIKDFLDSFNS